MKEKYTKQNNAVLILMTNVFLLKNIHTFYVHHENMPIKC